MRVQQGTILTRTGWLLAGLLIASGCQSTSSLPKSLTRDGNADGAGPVAWKKTAAKPSTAMAQDRWSNPPKDEAVRTTSFQEPDKKEFMPPIPEVMIKDRPEPEPLVMSAPPGSARHGKHFGKKEAAAPPPNAPNELNPVKLPSYVIRPSDVLTVDLAPQFARDENQKLKVSPLGLLNQPISGPHPVHPDGTISLGIYGTVPIAGKNIVDARAEIARVIHGRLDAKKVTYEDVLYNLKVDIANYNNGFYYIIINYAGAGGGGVGAVGIGEVVERFPVMGTETVLDAIYRIKGLPGMVSPSHIWVARATPTHDGPDNILPVDWVGISQHGVMASNWQVLPGDRIYLQAYAVRRFDNRLARFLSPIQRLLGVAQQVNVLRNNTNTNLVAPPLP